MKALDNMTTVEKARLFAGLFPQHLEGILEAVGARCQCLADNETEIRAEWDGFFTADFWFGLGRDIAKVLNKYGSKLAKKPSLFADQLFDGYLALFTVDCIVRHKKLSTDAKFITAVELFFE